MTTLSEVSILMGQRASDIEAAREVFKDEIAAFVADVLGGLRRVRTDPWTSSRVRLDLPREVESERRSAPRIVDHYALASVSVCFRRGVKFTEVAVLRFGIQREEPSPHFSWQVSFVPDAKYLRMDDIVWRNAKATGLALSPQAVHRERTNMIVFAERSLDEQLTREIAYADSKAALELLLNSEAAFAEAVGLELSPTTD